MSHELLAKIEKVKGLLAHKNPNLTSGDLFGLLCDRFLEEHSHEMTQKVKLNRPEHLSPPRKKSALAENAASKGRALRVHLKRQVWKRDKGQCQKCKSVHALQIDHIHPVALGGDNDLTNLRLLCRSCNQREAIKFFGVNKMAGYIDRSQD